MIYSSTDYEVAGNTVRSVSSHTRGDSSTMEIVDAWFSYDDVNTVYAQDYTLDVRTLFMPTLRGYACGTQGCQYDFYISDKGIYRKLRGMTFHDLYKAHCEKEYIVLGGGGGAGVTRAAAGVWAFSKKNMDYVSPVQKLDINNICNLVKEQSNGQ